MGSYITALLIGDTIVSEEDEAFSAPLVRYGQDDATLWGIEAQMEASVAARWVLGAMGDMTRGEFREGSALPFMPAARLGASARFDDGKRAAGVEARDAFAQERVAGAELATDTFP